MPDREPEAELGPFSAPGATLTPWSRTLAALRRSQKFHVTTVRPDGRPHVTPLLAVWALDGLCFVSGEAERKARNLSDNPHCILTAGSEGLTGYDYVVEGLARPVADADQRAAAATALEEAYGWNLTRSDGDWYRMGDAVRSGESTLYRLAPTRGYAYDNTPPFSETRYRWPADPA